MVRSADRDGEVEIRLLGPFEVLLEGAPVGLGTRKQRAVLALLALQPNATVPTDRLIDDLWGDQPPASARAVLQTYVAGLRKGLDGTGLEVETRGPGYALAIDPLAVDTERFQRLVTAARKQAAAGERAVAAAALREALGLWRGRALEDFGSEPGLEDAAERLEALCIAATEERIEAELDAGSSAALVVELEALVAEHPYRERLRGQLMRALYLDGRQGEALEAYRAARTTLADDLGVEPGPELRRLERAILEHDPELAPRGPPSDGPGPGPEPRLRSPSRRGLIALALATATVVAGGAAILVAREGDAAVVVRPNSVAVIDADTNEVVAQVPVGLRPGPIAAADGTVWVGNLEGRTLTRIDASRREVVGGTDLRDRTPTGVAVDRATVWVAHGLLGVVSLVDVQFGRIRRTVPVARKGPYSSTGSIAADNASVWVVFGDGTIARLSPVTGRPTATESSGRAPVAVAVGYGSAWVANSGSTVQRLSLLSNEEIGSYTVPSGPGGITVGAGDVWVTSANENLVTRIDVGNGSDDRIPVGDGPSAVAFGAGSVWVANKAAGTVSRIDPGTNTVAAEIDIGNAPSGLVVADGLVWVTVQAP